MPRMLIFGLGYTAGRLAHRLRADGWQVTGTRRTGDSEALSFDDGAALRAEIAAATHILSSVPPEGEVDPVLVHYGAELATAQAGWRGYISSTGVYGDTGGAWVDETAPLGSGRRSARAQADAAWMEHGARIFRLPGIYGPGRSPVDRIRAGKAHRIDLPGQVFSRIHVDDAVAGIVAALNGPAGAYNLADDEPVSQNTVIEYGAMLLGVPPPPLLTLEAATLSPAARAFYAENRRVANGKARRLLGWRPAFPSYREGLRALVSAPAPVGR
jgi:nucleoside-diphosphate-sugar epimerase